MSRESNEEFIDGLQKLGLSSNEAIVYYYLIQHGKKGTFVKDLKSHAKLERTTIYSILNRLLEMGCVIEAKNTDAPKQAKMFVATSPELYMEKILHEKRNELKQLETLKKSVIDRLETLFLQSQDFSFELVDDYMKPFLNPLIEKGWKILEYVSEKSSITYGFEAYDCTLLNPNAKFVKDAGFMIFKYDYEVEKDENTLNYMYGLLKRKGKEEVLNKGIGVIDLKLHEVDIDIKGTKYKGFIPEFKFEHSEGWMKMTEMVMIPQKEKIFSLWAEDHEHILEMTQGIYR